MRVESVVPWIVMVGALASWCPPRAAFGQQLAIAPRTLRFFYTPAAAAKPVEIDVSRNGVLHRVVSLHVEHASIGGLLADIQRQTGLTFAYDPHFPASQPVTLEADSITVAAALGAILIGTGVDVVLTPTGHAWLTESEARPSRLQEGSIVGRVTAKQTGDPLVGATVTLEPTGRNAVTGSDGQYRFANLNPGDYTVRARYIGYRALVVSVTVRADQEVVVDFPLEKSTQQLDEVVTTGTLVPTEVKALPTPITVISADDIAQRQPRLLLNAIRQAIPTAVVFDQPGSVVSTNFSVRGASSLSGTGVMKIFVDGVEAASFGVAPVDPASIDRIEVVRGPQAATLYGSDAAGGVVQIFTKRGDLGLTRPQVGAQVQLGMAQTPYPGYGGVLRQNYTGSVRGGGQDVSYNFGGGYTRLADWLPTGERSSQLSPSVYGGMHLARGIITADLSARYFRNKNPVVNSPELLTSGLVSVSRPNFRVSDFTNETYGARFTVSPTTWWRNQVTVGVDRSGNQSVQTQPRFTTPDDTLYTILLTDSRKISVGYNASVIGTLSSDIGASLTAGIDHYDQNASRFVTSRALTTEGTITTSPAGSVTESRTTITNTGYFAQAQVRLRDALFLTAGVRAEQNSTFGQDLSTPVLPRLGLSAVRQLGDATVKVRASYGRAIRAPSPGQAFGSVSAFQITLANPLLGPEQQQGWDGGVDLVFGRRASLSITGYDQIAKDLIAFVPVGSTSPPTSQFQNIGRVSNRGIEIEGTVTFHVLQLKGQYGYVRSRIEDLGPGVSPGAALQIGDQPLGLPAHTAGAAVTVAPRQGTTFTAGLTYVGSIRQSDDLALFRCFGGTGPCQATSRDYVVSLPGFAKVNAAITQRLTRQVEGIVSVDNLTNNQAFEGSTLSPVVGRITMVGFHVGF